MHVEPRRQDVVDHHLAPPALRSPGEHVETVRGKGSPVTFDLHGHGDRADGMGGIADRLDRLQLAACRLLQKIRHPSKVTADVDELSSGLKERFHG